MSRRRRHRRRRARRLLALVVLLGVAVYLGYPYLLPANSGGSGGSSGSGTTDTITGAPEQPSDGMRAGRDSTAGAGGASGSAENSPPGATNSGPASGRASSDSPAPDETLATPDPPEALTSSVSGQSGTPESGGSSGPADAPSGNGASGPSSQAPDGSGGQAGTSTQVRRLIESGMTKAQQGEPVAARDFLNRALRGRISAADGAKVRRKLAELNKKLIFSPEAHPDDPFTDTYVVQSGDTLAKIAGPYDVPWRFLARINGELNPRRIRAGDRIKVVKGPFHAVVHKSEFRLDVYLGKPDGEGVYVRSFPVGLGERNSTPVGRFVVKAESKLKNPEWVNPRTGERFLADNPENPLGEYWIGIRGVGEQTEELRGYGIHGTIEPDSIGTQASMGCVRLHPENIELLFAMIEPKKSRVTVVR